MSNMKQEMLVKNIKESISLGVPETKRRLLVKSGYSPKTANHPKTVLTSKGVVELMEKHGLNMDFMIGRWEDFFREKPEGKMSWDTHRKGLTDFTKIVLDSSEAKAGAAQTFIDRFIYVDKMGINKPKIHPGKYKKGE